ncbi:hypothetical protein NC652_035747 [Populus alba x Populus x berolinensis]|nr:hypothetical protein NC652_035747 [Populus alba x Populus x berolinensis]
MLAPPFINPKKYSSFQRVMQVTMVNLLDELRVNETILVGHSMSAMIGCIASIKRPELFRHLVLLGGSPRYLDEKGYNGGFTRSEINAIFKHMHHNYTSWVQAFAPTAIGMNNTRATTEFRNSLRRMKPRIALSVAKAVFLSDLEKHSSRSCGALHYNPVQKRSYSSKLRAYYMKRNLNGHARVKILDTGGHFSSAYSLQFAIESSEKISCERLAEISCFVGNKKQLSSFFLEKNC